MKGAFEAGISFVCEVYLPWIVIKIIVVYSAEELPYSLIQLKVRMTLRTKHGPLPSMKQLPKVGMEDLL